MDPADLLQHYLGLAQPYLQQYGYLALFLGVFVESFGIPAPGQSLVMAGALLGARGEMNMVAVLLLGGSAAILGDNCGYAIGRLGGRRLVERYGRYLGVHPRHLDRVERFFVRWGGGIVVVARFFEVLRQLNGIVAGIGRMPWWRFLCFNTIGAVLWVGLWGGAAYFTGTRIGVVLAVFKHAEPYVITAGVVGLVAAVVLLIRRKNKSD